MARSKESLQIGDALRLGGEQGDKISRRRFLKAVGIAGTGAFGLKEAISSAYGAEVEGTPIVHTRDIYGNPDQVRIIPQERYRRIQAYSNLDVSKLMENNPIVDQVSIKQQSEDESDLAIVLYTEKASRRAQQKLPSRLLDVPVVHEQRPTTRGLDCDYRQNRFDNMIGGWEIGANNTNTYGTLGFVGYNYNNQTVLVTANHIGKGKYYMHQPAEFRSNSRYVATLENQDPRNSGNGMDVTSYNLVNSRVGSKVRETWRNDVPDIQGTWDFNGLSDATSSGNTVPCEASAANNCKLGNQCNNTSRNDRVNYEADMISDSADGGDSGAAWVDGNGKLVGIHHGYESDWTGNSWDVAATGTEALQAINVKLYS